VGWGRGGEGGEEAGVVGRGGLWCGGGYGGGRRGRSGETYRYGGERKVMEVG